MQTLEDEVKKDEGVARLVIMDLQLSAMVEAGLDMHRDAHLTAQIIKAKLDSMDSNLKYSDVDIEED